PLRFVLGQGLSAGVERRADDAGCDCAIGWREREMRKEQSCSMKLARRAAWFAPGGERKLLSCVMFARVGAEGPRYPRRLRWLLPFGEPGAFFRRRRDRSPP